MSVTRRYSSADLEALPYVEGTRYEIIDGELHVSTQPRYEHQYACGKISWALDTWSDQAGLGTPIIAPGLIFAPDRAVASDLVWISFARLAAPELVVEVLSPGAANERRDREQKLALYDRQGVQEYWIADWRTRTVEVYRRREGAGLRLVATLGDRDALTTPLLPGFACPVSGFWPPAP